MCAVPQDTNAKGATAARRTSAQITQRDQTHDRKLRWHRSRYRVRHVTDRYLLSSTSTCFHSPTVTCTPSRGVYIRQRRHVTLLVTMWQSLPRAAQSTTRRNLSSTPTLHSPYIFGTTTGCTRKMTNKSWKCSIWKQCSTNPTRMIGSNTTPGFKTHAQLCQSAKFVRSRSPSSVTQPSLRKSGRGQGSSSTLFVGLRISEDFTWP
jgi:hypothetical protein